MEERAVEANTRNHKKTKHFDKALVSIDFRNMLKVKWLKDFFHF